MSEFKGRRARRTPLEERDPLVAFAQCAVRLKLRPQSRPNNARPLQTATTPNKLLASNAQPKSQIYLCFIQKYCTVFQNYNKF